MIFQINISVDKRMKRNWGAALLFLFVKVFISVSKGPRMVLVKLHFYQKVDSIFSDSSPIFAPKWVSGEHYRDISNAISSKSFRLYYIIFFLHTLSVTIKAGLLKATGHC